MNIRHIKPETAIEFAQVLQHGTFKPPPLVLQRMEMVPPRVLPPERSESQGTDLLTYLTLGPWILSS